MTTYVIPDDSNINPQKRLQQLEVINQIARAVNHLDLDQVLETIYRQLHQLMATDFFFVGFYDAMSNHLTFRGVYDAGKRLPDHTVSLDNQESISKIAIETRQTQVVHDVDEGVDAENMAIYGEVTRSCIFVPLILKEDVVGVLSVQSMEPYEFDAYDISMLESIAAQAGTAIHNARLYSETQQRLEQVSELQQLAEELTSLDTVPALAAHSVKRLCRIFEASASVLFWQEADHALQTEVCFPQIDTTWRPSVQLLNEIITKGPHYLDFNTPDEHFPDFFGSLISIPLLPDDGTKGALIVGSVNPYAFSDEQLQLLTIAASTCAAAIRNSRLLTETRQRARDLENAYRELQELDQLRQEVVNNVSHELRSPLAYVRAYVELMEAGEMGNITKQQADAMKIIERKTASMLRLINDILELEKIRPETLQRQPEPIAALLQQTLHAARLAYMTRDVHLSLECTNVDDVYINIDVVRIEQVLNNLISNAVKFSPPGGKVVIICIRDGNALQVNVTDEGEGIPPDKLTRIFERFYRVPGTSTDGIGIGLAIVQQIINAHGGEIEVQSIPGEGTRFSISLPLEQDKT